MLIALNGPTEGAGDEETYNDWYSKVHVPDLLSLDGVTSARRFKKVRGNRADWPYAATYEIETDDIDAVMKKMETDIRPFTPKFDRTKSAFVLVQEMDA
jgi:hypothetical protein